jgi:hypothetical protein
LFWLAADVSEMDIIQMYSSHPERSTRIVVSRIVRAGNHSVRDENMPGSRAGVVPEETLWIGQGGDDRKKKKAGTPLLGSACLLLLKPLN